MPSRYPSTLSQGQGGPSRRPTRQQCISSSIDDDVPPPPFDLFTTAAAPPPVASVPLKKSKSRPLNPNSKPYTPKNFRSVQDLRSMTRAIEPHYPSIPPPEAFHSFHPGPESTFAAQTQQQRPQYSSLQHLLEQAGYADTRVETPPAERVGRRIKKTFDEVDAEEVRDLYSTFGLASQDPQHRYGYTGAIEVTHITEPGLPLKSSSSLLRNLALQDSGVHYNQQQQLQQHHQPQQYAQSPTAGDFESSYDSWWGGGFAALGRAAKAVMEMSPPSKGNESFEEVARQMSSSSGVGLGLAKGGEGVRKVKSNWELGGLGGPGGVRDQEQTPPAPAVPPLTLRERRSAVVDTILPPLDLPPVPINMSSVSDDDEFGFSPLPADYEAQCDDDEFFTTSFDADVGSLESTPTERSRESTVEKITPRNKVDTQLREVSLNSPESVKSLGFGLAGYDLSRRIMADAVDYDDCDQDSPTKKSFVKPLPNFEPTEPAEVKQTPEQIAPDRASPAASVPTPCNGDVPVRKYGDRATKLRMARSTPALTRPAPRPDPSWFGSIKSYIMPASAAAAESSYTSIPSEPSPSTSAAAPLKLTPALPAQPALAKPVAVVCDSTSDMAEDLPPLPRTITVAPPPSVIASVALRTRKSLASLRSAWTGTPVSALPPLPSPTPSETLPTPVLSPRLDLAESEYFAGWSPRRDISSPSGDPAWSTPKKVQSHEDGYGPTEIDYTRSFFYKPCTPPVASSSSSASAYEGISAMSGSDANTGSGASSNPVARRQRSIKSLRAALLLPVASPAAAVPPVPTIPDLYRSALTYATARSASGQSDSTTASSTTIIATPPQLADSRLPEPPAIAILSPGAWEAGLPPRELVLEGEEWDARDGQQLGEWSRGREAGKGKGKKGKGSLKRKNSKKTVRAD